MTTEPLTAETPAYPICRHVKTNGLRCQSPALSGEPFCYFHVRLHKEHHRALTAREIVNARNRNYPQYEEALLGAGEDPMQIARAYPDQNEINFPPLEDAESIQFAASMLFHAVAQGRIHLRRARILRDMLRVAAASCGRAAAAAVDSASEPRTPIRDIEQSEHGLSIALADTWASAPPAPQLSLNQDFGCNPSELNILPEPPALTHLN